MTKLATLSTAAVLASTLLAARPAGAVRAAPPPAPALTTTVFTAGPGGFGVDSTLIAGEHDAILVDAQFSLAEAHRLVAMILESKKTLTTVYITHSHPDHYFGLAVIQAAFPKAKLVALPQTVADIKKTWAGKVKQWSPMFGALVPLRPVLPTALKGATLTLEGVDIEVHGTMQGDDAHNSYLWIPSTKTIITGDVVYNGTHVWTAETNAESRKAWMATLDQLAALNATTVIAGHKDPKQPDTTAAIKGTKDYLIAFDAAVLASKSSAELQQKIKARFPALALEPILQMGADAQFAPAAAKPNSTTK